MIPVASPLSKDLAFGIEERRGCVLGGPALYVLVPGDTKRLVRFVWVLGATSAHTRFVVGDICTYMVVSGATSSHIRFVVARHLHSQGL